MSETVSGTLVGMIDVGTSTSGVAATLLLDDGTTITGNGTGTLTIGAGSTLDIEAGLSNGLGATLDGVTAQQFRDAEDRLIDPPDRRFDAG